MSDTEDSTDEIREAAIGVLSAVLYSLAIIKGDNNQDQLSNFLDIILKSWCFQKKKFNLIQNIVFYLFELIFYRF